MVVDGGDLLLVPVDEEHALADPERGSRRPAWPYAVPIISSMLPVMDAATHLSRAAGPGCSLRRAGGAAMSSGSRTAGVKSATATTSAIVDQHGALVAGRGLEQQDADGVDMPVLQLPWAPDENHVGLLARSQAADPVAQADRLGGVDRGPAQRPAVSALRRGVRTLATLDARAG